MNLQNLFETPVDSSWIADLTYDEEKGATILTTLRGSQYTFPMSEEMFENWLAFWSKGRFYHYYVKESTMRHKFKIVENTTKTITPARRTDIEYNEKKIKGALDRVTAILDSKQSAPYTRIARIYKRLDQRIKTLTERRNMLNDAVKKKAERIFDAEDAIVTRVVETITLSIMITKPGEPTSKPVTVVNQEAIINELTGLLTEVDSQLVAIGQQYNLVEKMQAIMAKHTTTTVKTTPGAPHKLRVDFKDPKKDKVTESVETNAEHVFDNITDTFYKKVMLWTKSFDRKIGELKYDAINI